MDAVLSFFLVSSLPANKGKQSPVHSSFLLACPELDSEVQPTFSRADSSSNSAPNQRIGGGFREQRVVQMLMNI